MKIEIPESECEILVSRSGGAGGQNVNKVNTKITLRWNYLDSISITDAIKSRFKKRYLSRISTDGFITIISQEHRTQKLNLSEAFGKLNALVEEVRVPPKPRIKTKPTKASKEKRMDSKKKHGDTKKLRSEKY